MNQIRYQFEGPFDSSYSLASVNREMARALEALRPGSVALYSTEGPGDFTPSLVWLQADPQIVGLWQRSSQQAQGALPEVTLRNLYPPRVSGMSGRWHVMNNYAWEESGFPAAYVEQFNQHLHLLAVTSAFVRKTLVDNGVTVPIVVIGNGVDHNLRHPLEPVALPQGNGFIFLHISSCFPRKGVDVLLDAYTAAFTAADDVLLVIKGFPNPHNTIEQQIREAQSRKPDCPAIHLINEDLSIGQVNSLYQQADALVAPSRGEGFGLPMAEAMLWDVPVITTGYGGQRDFCTSETAWLVDYQFARAQTHMGLFDSLWVEPDVLHLMSVMRSLYQQVQDEAGRDAIKVKTARARQVVEEGWGWQRVAGRLLVALDALEAGKFPSVPLLQRGRQEERLGDGKKVAWVTTWNTRCGIASYSEFLLQYVSLPVTVLANMDSTLTAADGENVIRCWETGGGKQPPPSLAGLLQVILDGQYSEVAIQFNYAFFDLPQLQALLKVLHGRGIAVYLFFHATQDLIVDGKLVNSLRYLGDALHGCKRLLVHGVEDVNRLKRFGYVDNVSLIPHGVMYAPELLAQERDVAQEPAVFRIAAYGFLLPGKGLPELIAAFALLRQRLAAADGQSLDVRLALYNALYPNVTSQQEWQRCVDLIRFSDQHQHIHLQTDFCTDDETLRALSACDVVVFPYQRTRESASGAVRLALASGRPVACTPLSLFDDIQDVVHFLPGQTPQAIANGLYALLKDATLLSSKRRIQQDWLETHAWDKIAKRLEAMFLG